MLGALTVVELMDAHRGFDIITASIKATKKKELVVIIGVLTFLRLRRRPKRREREERDLRKETKRDFNLKEEEEREERDLKET